jgi:hypothetical protein
MLTTGERSARITAEFKQRITEMSRGLLGVWVEPFAAVKKS